MEGNARKFDRHVADSERCILKDTRSRHEAVADKLHVCVGKNESTASQQIDAGRENDSFERRACPGDPADGEAQRTRVGGRTFSRALGGHGELGLAAGHGQQTHETD